MRRNVISLWDGKVFLAAAVLYFCLLAAQVNYQEVYKRTPDYSVSCMLQAISQQDAETLSQYVDEASLTGQFFDALASHTSDSTDETFLLKLIRSPMRATFVNDMTTFLTWTLEGSQDSQEYQKLQTRLEGTLKHAGLPLPLSGWHVESADWSRAGAQSGEKTITLHLYNDRLQLSVPCTVTLVKTGSKTWRITSLDNPAGFLRDLRQALDDKLEAYNQPLQAKIDAVMTVSDVSSTLVTANGQARFLRLSYTPSIKGDRSDITSVKAQYTLHRDRDDAVLFTSPIRLSTAAEKRTHQSQFRLNPLIPSQAAIINQGNLDGLTTTLHITAITFTDGSEIAIADKLPEN